MAENRISRPALLRFLKSTSKRSFIVYPLLILAIELILRSGDLRLNAWGVPLLAWGYAQYRLVGMYRIRFGGGGPGLDTPPDRIVERGPYRFTRNPMYLGHMIFMAGLAIIFRSLAALVLLLINIPWFHMRALKDEARLEKRFGAPYLAYKARVKRWIPFVL